MKNRLSRFTFREECHQENAILNTAHSSSSGRKSSSELFTHNLTLAHMKQPRRSTHLARLSAPLFRCTLVVLMGIAVFGLVDLAHALPVSERTPQVRDEIVDAVPGVDAAADVTEAHLAAITSLNLSRKSITSLKSGDFDGLTALVNLSLSNNQLSALPPGIFDNNTALIYLDLPNNQLSALPPGIFDNNTTLVNLSLSNNQLSALPPGIFDNNTTLRRLSLSNNQLSALPPGIFSGLSSMIWIMVDNNQLTTLPENTFSGLSSLTLLNLYRNNLSSLPEDAFSGLPSLREINLAGNNLSSLPEGLFSGLSSLKHISLWQNQLTTLPAGIFSGLTSLTEIDFKRNQLSSLPAGLFTGLSSLTTINLEWNQLSNLPSDIFSGLSSLTTINLGINQLSSLPEGLFSGLSSLTSLNLNQNAAELSIIVLLQEVAANQFKVMVRPGAPFNIVVPINVMNGSIDGGGTIVTIPTGSVASEPFTVTPIPGTSAAITVEIGTLPSIPSDHRGYSLIQLNRAPEFTEGPITTRTVAEDTTAGINIGTAVSATDVNNDLLTYTLSGADANFFTVDNTTGQLRTSSTLDYETKPTYTVTVTVMDGTFTSSIIVTINVTDVEPETFYVSEPRTVRLFYYLPNDRSYRQEVVDAMKTGIIEIQSFYAEQMEAHGHGNMTFQIETDAQGDPIVHRVDGANDNNYYDNRRHPGPEIDQAFDNSDNVHVIVMDINRGLSGLAGGGNKNARWAIVYGGWNWRIAAHELGHAFGLLHDFRDDAYLMSYGSTDQASTELSAFAADFLSVQPYFNPDISLEIESPPTFELLSPTIYLTGAESVPIRLRVRDDDGIYQVVLLVKTSSWAWGGGGGKEVKTYRKLAGETDTIVEFDYDGKNPSGGTSLSHPLRHEIYFMVVDTEGNNAEGNYTGSLGWTVFTLEGLDELYPLAGRTRQVQDAIVAAVPDIDNAADVTEAHLATITSLDLSWSSLTLKTGDFSGLSALTTLSLGGNDLTSLPEGVFSGLSALTTLNLSGNDLTSLPEGVFSGLSALTTINLNSNDLTSLPEGVFSSLSALTTINLNSNDLTSLPEGVFSGLSALTTLDLRNNDLTSLPEGVFSGLSALTTLDLRNNDLTSLPEGVFSGLSALTTLRLNSNDLTSLPEGVFSGLSALTTLILSSNDLTSLPEGVFSGLSSVTSLNLLGNAVEPMPLPVSLEKVGDDQFKAVAPAGAPFDIVLPLTLTNGSISGGAPTVTILTGSTESKVLTVTRTPDTTGAVTVNIRRVPLRPSGHTGYALVKSADLLLSYALPEIHTVLGNRTPQVRDAIVAAAGVNSATDLTEAHLAAITELNLWNKGITSLKSGDFDGLSGLTRLLLRYNRLTTLPSDIFDGLTALTRLDMAFNDLSSLPAGLFEGLTGLTTLSFSSNAVRPLPLTVSLEKIGDNQFKAVVPTGALFAIVLPISVTNGSITGGATTVTIPKGSVESEVLTVTRTPGTTGAVTVNIGTLPSLPQKHFGYALVKSADLPLSYALPEIRILIANRTPEVRDAIIAAVPGVDAANDITDAHLAAITSIDFTLNNSVKVGDFEGLTGLTTLGLDTGQLTSLPAGLFNDLSNVTLMEIYSEEGLTTLATGAFDGLTSLEGFEWKSKQLNTLPANIFDQLTNLTYLLFYGGQLNTLPDDVFDQLTKLTTLALFSDRLTSLPDGVFDELTQLTSLSIGRTQLMSLPDGLFSGLSSLTSLNLSNNAADPMPLTVSLEKVAAGQFKAVASTGAPFDLILPITVENGSITDGVTTLTIPKGSVGSEVLTVTRAPGTTYAVSVNIGTLPALPSNHRGYTLVKFVNLPLEFGELGGRVFIPVSQRTPQVRDKIVEAVPGVNSAADVTKAHLAAITGLVLANGGITTLQPGDFDGLTALTTLRVTDEQLSNVPAGIFDGLSSLETLTLTGNFSSLPDGVFDGLTSLTFLTVGGPQLSSLSANIFDELTSLTFLTVGGPQLSSLSANIFDELTSLTTLAVGGGRLNNLPMGVFNELTNLTKLFLIEGTPLGSNLPAGIFDKLATLTELYLEGIQLTALPVGIFDKLTALTRLSLENNQLTSLPAGIFDQLTALKHLYLNSNELSSLPAGVFDELTALTGLGLSHNQLSSLPDGVFHELTALTTLRLHKNQLSSLPDDVFHGLTALTELLLYGNTVDPLPLTVSLEKVADGQFKAVVPAGAPFDIVLPISVSYGSISGSATTITIPTGSVESEVLTVTRTSTDPASVNIGTLPRLPFSPAPAGPSGYILVKSDALPLEVISGQSKIGEQGRPGTANEAPVFTDGTTTTRTIAANTAAGVNIGTPVAATDANNDTLTYTLSGTDATSFAIDTATGQLQTNAALDYETKSIYTVTITVSDGNLTNTITVTINITDVDDTPVVATLPPVSERTPQVRDEIVRKAGVNSANDVTEAHLAAITLLSLSRFTNITTLKAGDFDGLTGLTSLNLSENQLSTLPEGIFDDLTALTLLELNDNQLSTLPADIFDELAKLRELHLYNNQIATLPAGTFDGLSWLDQLFLQGNQLTTLPAGIFDKLTGLRNLNLEDNKLTSLPEGIFNKLTALNYLTLADNRLTTLPAGIFDGPSALYDLWLDGNRFASLPMGIFKMKASFFTLRKLYLEDNTVDPLSLTVSLEKVADGQFKAVAPTGAPFDIVLPLTVANGNITGGATTVTIPKGSVESDSLTVTRTPDTTGAVTVNIVTLPSLPSDHSGYALVKSTDLPLEVISSEDTARQETDVNIPDPNLRAEIEDALGKKSGDPISETEMATLTTLTAQRAEISNLTGLQTATNLTTLKLGDNSVSDISALAGLTSLTELQLWDNQISNLSILANLTNLTKLYIWGNSISDISALAGLTSLTKLKISENTISNVSILSRLTNLTELSLKDNAISDISALAGLTNLTELQIGNNTITNITPVQNLTKLVWLDMPNNSISDISVVQNLTKLAELYFQNNAVSDLSPLVANTGFGEFTELNASGNPLNYPSIYTHIPALQARNVYIEFDNRVATTPVKISGDTQSGTTGTTLAQPFVVEVQDASRVAFAGVPVTFAVTAGGGTLSATNTTTDTNGRAESTLTLGNTAGTNTVRVSIQGVSQTATFTATAATTNTAPVFTDGTSTTRTIAENTAAGVNIGAAIAATDADNDTLTYTLSGTDAASFSINSSTGQLQTKAALDYETKRTYTVTVTVSDGSLTNTITVTINVTDIDDTPTATTAINVPDPNLRAKIEDALGKASGDPISATEMATLTSLTAQDASISNLTGLETATNLTTLKLGDNSISDISALAGLTNLTELQLWDNQISNISILASLTNLTKLYIWGNSISDISALAGLTSLTQLKISENTISNISILSRLTNLTELSLKANAISDISALAGLTNLTELLIGNNTISNITPVQNLTNLEWLDMPNNRISDVTAVVNLTNLVELYFQDNTVSDLSPLVANTGFGEYTELDARGNPLSYPSIYTHIPALQARNVYVDFDNRVATAPVKISGDTQSGTTGTTLAQPFVVEVQDASRVVFAGVPVTFAITAGGGTLNVSNTATNANGRAESTLTLGNTAGTNTVHVSVQGISQAATFTATATTTNTAPVFTDGASTTRVVAENTAAGVNIGSVVVATDADNDTLTYTLSGTDAASFGISSSTGQLQTKAALDYETKRTYVVTITVSDGTLTDIISVIIIVTDVVENTAPIFTDGASTTRVVAENTATGVNIGTPVAATDAQNDTLTYTLSGTDAASFSISSTTGQLKTKSALDYETKRTYIGTITVSDGTLTDIISVIIIVTDVVENTAPVFTEGTSTTRVVAENTATGVNIGTPVAATDAQNDTLTYTLSGTDAASFSISSTTGQLKTKSALDYETKRTYIGTITVSDGTLTDIISVIIIVTDVVENTAPVFTEGTSTTRSVAENTATGVNIGSAVAATDADNDTLTYTLGGTNAASFGINSITGQLRTRAALDYETKRSYTITVSVSDGTLTDTITVTISVTNVDEVPEEIGDSESLTAQFEAMPASHDGVNAFTFELRFSQEIKMSYVNMRDDVLDVTGGTVTGARRLAKRLENGKSSNLRWEITIAPESNADVSITLPPSADCAVVGAVCTATGIALSNRLEAIVLGSGTQEPDPPEQPPVTANTAPVFTDGASTTRTIAENTAAGVNIGSAVAATDADNDTLTYTLGGTNAASFGINSITGQLRTRAALDYETKRTYTVTVTVSDGSLTDTITVTINVTDVDEAPTDIGVCKVGDILAPGESCTYPGTDATFSVLDNGHSQWNIPDLPSWLAWINQTFIGGSMRISATINNQDYHFVAEEVSNDSWEIKEIGEDRPEQPETPEQPEQPGDVGETPTLTVSTASSLTEATLHGGVATLTLSGGTYESTVFDIRRSLTVSGITGADFETFSVVRVSDTQATVELEFDGNISTSGTLTFNLESDAIANYEGAALTSQISVPAVTESVTASTAAPLTEATLDESVVTLTLSGRKFERNDSTVRTAVSVSGIAGVTVQNYNIDRESDTEVTVQLTFNGNINTNSTLTFTVGAEAIAGYNGPALTAQVSVSASEEPVEIGGGTLTLRASTPSPLTEATLNESVVTLTLTGGTYSTVFHRIRRSLTVSGITRADIESFSLVRVSDTQATVELEFDGNISTNSTLTFTLRSAAIANYDGDALTSQISVSALPESVVASTPQPLTEANLHGSVVTLTLTGGTYEIADSQIRDAVTVSGINGVTMPWHDPDRESNTELTLRLAFDGTDFDTNSTLTFIVGADAIVGYDGAALTTQVSVSGLEEPVLRASTPSPLTEATLNESVVTLTLTGGTYSTVLYRIRYSLTVSGITRADFKSSSVVRVSDTQATVELEFDGNISTNSTLTFTLRSAAIANYDGDALTSQISVSASEEPVEIGGGTLTLRASTPSPLTEATLHESVVTLTLTGRIYSRSTFDIRDAVTVSGINGVTKLWHDPDRESDTELTLELEFDGDFDTDATLTFTVGAGAIAGYDGPALTAQVPVTGGSESIVASTDTPLTEATLNESVVTLTLTGRAYEDSSYTVARAITVSGIDGVTFGTWDIDEVSDTEIEVELTFNGDFDTNVTLTFTVGADAIVGYDGPALTAQVSVTGGPESIVASTDTPLTEATLNESVVTLTLTGRAYEDSSYSIRRAITVSGIDGVTLWDIDEVSDTEIEVELTFNGDFDTNVTLTFTVGADAIVGYDGPALTAQVSVTGGPESIVASTDAPLTETTLDESVVTLTLSGRIYEDSSFSIRRAVTVSGIDGVTVRSWDVDRKSDTEVTVELTFNGDFDTNATLTFTVDPEAIAGYNGPALTAQISVSATEQVLRAPSGISLMHVPLQVTAVNGVTQTIESVGDLYEVLGGADAVNLLITHNPRTQSWHSYLGESSRGTSADTILTDNQGIIADMKAPVSLHLDGNALGSNGSSSITLHPGTNLVGVPLRDSRITHVSDLFALEGIRGNVSTVTVLNNGTFQTVGQASDLGDILITGGQSFILNAWEETTVAVSGQGWDNVSGRAAAAPVALTGIQVGDTTPVLALRGSIVSPIGGRGRLPHLRSGSGFRVIVKNLSTGSAIATVAGDEDDRYQLTVVDTEAGRAAQIGDILEISVRSPDPRIGVQPLRHTITAEDVKSRRVELGNLIVYEIPTETELLPNYPNPFNPETWIPYRLAEDAFVTLTIYDGEGQVVRTLEVGHRVAAVYESRSKAIYWDGRNKFGEQVASGVYFYHLSTGRSGLSVPHRSDFSATRKMLILK